MSIKELENNGELQLLVFLLENGKTKITDIKINAAKATLYHAIDALSKLELIDEERNPPVTRYLKLTGDGKLVAQKLIEIQQILQAKKTREAKRASPQ
jgi:DNA-binding MarR family transcriptional regulator